MGLKGEVVELESHLLWRERESVREREREVSVAEAVGRKVQFPPQKERKRGGIRALGSTQWVFFSVFIELPFSH